VVNDPQLGQILVTSDGLALYANTVDSPDQLRCTNVACTGFWPPYLVSAQPGAVEGISGSLGTVTRPDGSQQLTYNHQPLYTFYLDKAPGDAKGNGFTDLGGTWHVVTLEGAPAGNTPAPATSSGGYGY
jgi:predicted lipoprotein with Yx(FWY)xxD motif